MPRDEDFQGEGYDEELEKRSELVYDLPEPDADAPSGDGGDGGNSGGGDGGDGGNSGGGDGGDGGDSGGGDDSSADSN